MKCGAAGDALEEHCTPARHSTSNQASPLSFHRLVAACIRSSRSQMPSMGCQPLIKNLVQFTARAALLGALTGSAALVGARSHNYCASPALLLLNHPSVCAHAPRSPPVFQPKPNSNVTAWPLLASFPLLSTASTLVGPVVKIPPSSNVRRPANIPLHTLSSASRPRDADSAYLLDDHDKDSPRSSFSTATPDSDFSLWSDTGDLVDQLADAEDPLRIRLRDSLEAARPPKHRRQQKRVRYASQDETQEKPHQSGAVRKEDIEIPEVAHRTISRAEQILASVMAPGDGPSRIHGLHGKKLIYFTSVFVSLGVFLFGYDQGVMSGIITGGKFKDFFQQPTAAELGTMVAILEIGAFISSLVVGKIGDILGRRRTILYGSLIFVVGGALQTFATGMPMMMLGRIIAGLGVGTLSTIVPVYQSEISPPHNRGKLACIEFTGNISGYAASVWVDYFCTYIPNHWSWRLPLFMQCFMGALLAAGSLLICESPRWLLDNDHDEEGIVVIANLYGKGDIHNPKARDEYREIKMNVLLQRQEGERSYADMFRRYSKRVFIAMSAQALAQLNGINVISYYAPLVFEEAGWMGRRAILMTGINAITYLLSTIPPWYVVDTLGRRKVLLSGAIAMMLSLSAISYFIFLQASWTPNLVVLFVMIYNAAFGASWGPIPWLYPPEILPLSIRAKGASLSTATNWAFNWLVGEMTPILQEHIGWRLYLIHAFFCAVSFVIVWFIYPETANVRLEDMNSLFGDATSVMPTPQTLAEAESLFSGHGSPVPSLDIRSGRHGAESAIPGLNIDPPDDVEAQDAKSFGRKEDAGEGIGGWISNIVKKSKGNGEGDSSSGKYKQVGQDDDDA
ncbi:and other transporter-domain-containing protein [Clohesyomyces aquaticus]|uniref:And other transporter-domain-containing protein n=1 Tax=Clohesyomyces aquaticus TaxID=1231657 RepID=A0A1Y1ZK09_9PLEO|nr:and other transporter-domain-containing protein [Clohesyomyces aquaticus]